MTQQTTQSPTPASQAIHQLAPRIARGELSPLDVVGETLTRIGQLNDKLHAYVSVYGEEAQGAAEAAGGMITAGHYLGPLHGLPVAVKDLCEMEGRVTTMGSRVWEARRSSLTATVVERLRAAGMVIVGKTHMVEFALGGWGRNAHMGAPWNPWDMDTHRVAGGSSSGSGVAVAAGLAAAALGSDTGGSVRIPASFCGLVGLKPTHGRISNHGVLPLCAAQDSIGPMTRSVQDCAWLFAALMGPDPRDPDTMAAPHLDPLPGLRKGVAGLRIGMLPTEMLHAAWPLHPEVEAHYQAAGRVLADLGARVEEARPSVDLLNVQREAGVLMATEGYQIHREYIHDESLPFDPAVRGRLLAGREVSGADYVAAWKAREAMRMEMAAWMADYDALLSPTTPIPAPPLTEADEAILPHSVFTRPANYARLCALAVPMGRTEGGLPTSLQVMGAPWREDVLLRIGFAFEQALGLAPLAAPLAAAP